MTQPDGYQIDSDMNVESMGVGDGDEKSDSIQVPLNLFEFDPTLAKQIAESDIQDNHGQ